MPTYVVKLDEWWLEWSTVVDAPITYGMSEAEFRAYYRDEHGRRATEDPGDTGLESRMARARERGTSGPDDLDGLIACNRAGPGEAEITRDEIVAAYCPGPPPWETDEETP